MPAIPNSKQLLLGAGLCIAFAAHLVLNVGYDLQPLFWTLGVGLPIAFLFLMFTNPVERKPGDWGIVIAMPFVALLWPIILLVLVLQKPWDMDAWKARDRPSTDEASEKGT